MRVAVTSHQHCAVIQFVVISHIRIWCRFLDVARYWWNIVNFLYWVAAVEFHNDLSFEITKSPWYDA